MKKLILLLLCAASSLLGAPNDIKQDIWNGRLRTNLNANGFQILGLNPIGFFPDIPTHEHWLLSNDGAAIIWTRTPTGIVYDGNVNTFQNIPFSALQNWELTTMGVPDPDADALYSWDDLASRARLWLPTADFSFFGTSPNKTFGLATQGGITPGSYTASNITVNSKGIITSIASGTAGILIVDFSTLAALPANTYNNGTAGVGATLTGNSNGALGPIGHVSLSITTTGSTILVHNESNTTHNGVYVVTQIGDGSHPYILTRTTNFDEPNEIRSTIVSSNDSFHTTDYHLPYVLSISATQPITIGTTGLFFGSFGATIDRIYQPGTVGTVAFSGGTTGQTLTKNSSTNFDWSWTTPSGGGGTITLSGDVTGSGTTAITTTLANIPTGVTMAGRILATNIAAPSTPASGTDQLYVDSTDKRFHDKNDAGTIGTTVVADTGASNNFLTAVSVAGVLSKAQPSFTNLSGSVAASQMPALTGDVTTSAGAVATTVANNAITYAKMQDVSATSRFLGRITAGAGDPEELTAANGWTILGVQPAANFPALTGDVTTAAGALATTIATNAVTNAKAAQMAANTIKGNNTGSTANAIDMTTTQLKTLLALAASDVSGVTTPTTTDTFTNKTYDAAATGNVLKFKKYLQFATPMRADNVGAILQTGDPSQTYFGQAKFSNSAAASANYTEYRLIVPEDVDTAVDLRAKLKFQLSATDTGTHRYVISMASVADSAAYAGTLTNAVNMDFAGDASGAANDVETVGWTTLTSWKSSVTAGQLLVIRVARDGATSDTSTVDSYSGPLVIEVGVTQ